MTKQAIIESTVLSKYSIVLNCSQLFSIEIGEYSFGKYEGELKLLSLPALQNLTIGSIENESNNFMYSPKLYIGCIMNYILV